jgi:hypothetical protein
MQTIKLLLAFQRPHEGLERIQSSNWKWKVEALLGYHIEEVTNQI